MTAAEMKSQFLAQYDAATSLAGPGWEDDEISSFLNKAQKDMVVELFNKRILDLISNLIVTEQISLTNSATITNAVISSLDLTNVNSHEFLYYISSTTQITRTSPTVTAGYVSNELIDVKDSLKFHKTDMNKVWFKYPKCYMEYISSASAVLVVLYDSYTNAPTNGRIRFIKAPVEIDISGGTDTDINPVLHQEIVTKAVDEAVKSIKIAKISNQ